ncbi:hypothetical protein J7T55_005490 [Diaporthe amygdali]|uniref:uncharacterized protein n=1 Tax=Phomopsis amygdali TaxID=1214568 RepID=UPI0022FDEEE1|nr:uncharacterized protein J7T55_005490 [Diaporthe amygdali]KAJ0108943.1 hypothetical protein J7T55_005490 [Diaporthe amygdali]
MPPRPAHIRPSSSIHLPRYTIPFLLNADPSGLHSEQTMELRGGLIERSGEINSLDSDCSEAVISLGLPPVEALALLSGHNRSLDYACHSPFEVLGSFDVKHRLRVRKKKSRPINWKCIRLDASDAFQFSARPIRSRIADKSNFNAETLPPGSPRMAAEARVYRSSPLSKRLWRC